jgi:hypothetical protein
MKAIQCTSCGAPLNVTFGQRYVPCGFCGSTIDVGARTALPGHAGATNPGATAQGPYAAAYQGQRGRPNAAAPVAVVLIGVVGAFVALAGAGFAFYGLSGSSSRSSVPTVSTPGGGTRLPSLPSIAKANHFNDASAVPGQIKAKFGPRLLVKELVVYDEYVIFTAQNPAKPDNLDSYTLRNGSIDDGRPQTFVGDRRKLEAELFSIDDIPFASLASIGRDALGRFQAAGLSEGKVTHIIVTRENFGRGPGVVVRPYVSSVRKGGGYIEYDIRGGFKRMVGPSLRGSRPPCRRPEGGRRAPRRGVRGQRRASLQATGGFQSLSGCGSVKVYAMRPARSRAVLAQI